MVDYIACHVVCVSNTLSYIQIALLYYVGVAALYHADTWPAQTITMDPRPKIPQTALFLTPTIKL